jgi:hypothetical protein
MANNESCAMGRSSEIPKEVVVHVGFHLFWVLLALLSLAGAFFFIPFIGIYETFVLGVLFQAMPDSRGVAYAIGLALFIASGIASAGVRAVSHKATSWASGFLSLIATVFVLMVISLCLLSSGVKQRAAVLGASSATDLSDIGDFDQLGVWIKAAYYLPKHPPFLTNSSSLVRLETALPALSKATSVPPPRVGGWYLNLDADCWSALRSGTTSPVLVAWSDVTNQLCTVVQINLQTDIVDVEAVQRGELERLYGDQRNIINQVYPTVRLPESVPTVR